MITSFEAATKIGDLSNWSVTNLQLQKLLYISHMVYLGLHNKKLIEEKFEAWNLGPVLPSVYHRLKIFGDKHIRNIFSTDISTLNDKDSEFNIIKQVYEILGKKEAYTLVSMTHKEGGGWAKNFNPRLNITIPDKDILEEYNRYYNDSI